MDQPTGRQVALADYLREVALDLVMRGIVRNHQGWTPVQILLQEPAVVWGTVVRDFKQAGFSVGKDIIGGFAQTILGAVAEQFRRR